MIQKENPIDYLQIILRNQLIILEIENKWKETSIYLAFPEWTVPQGNQIIYERMLLFIKIHVTNKEKLMELDYCVNTEEIMNSASDCRWLLATKRDDEHYASW